MRRAAAALVGLFGVLGIAGSVVLAVTLTPVTAADAGVGAALVFLAGVAVALAKLYRSGEDDEAVEPAPWTEDGALVGGTPEETAAPADVTGEEFAGVVDRACERARESDAVEEGFEAVRPSLRATLTRVLEQDGTDPDAIESVLASGEWTDDRVAAAVVDAAVRRPPASLRERLAAWLFPERVVRRDTARAVAAIADAADRELPPVVGQRAPRTVPVAAPPLGSLQRAADGTLQPVGSTSPTGDPRNAPSDGTASGARSETVPGSDGDAGAAGGVGERSDRDGDPTDRSGSDGDDDSPARDDGHSITDDRVPEAWDDA